MEDNSSELFVEPMDERQTKLAEEGLPVDTEEWPSSIKEQLRKKHPYLGKYDIKVDLKNVDKKSRSAIGAVGVRADDETIFLPLIIEDGAIKPFDIMIYEGEPQPLTKKRVRNIFQNFDISSEIVEDDEADPNNRGDTIYDEQLQTPSSSWGVSGTVRTASAETNEGELLERLDGNVREKDAEKLAESLNDDRILASLAGTSGADVAEKAATIETTEASGVTPGEFLGKFAESEIFLCKEASPNEVTMVSTPSHVYHPRENTVSFKMAKSRVKKAGYDPSRLDEMAPGNPVVFGPDTGEAKEASDVTLNHVQDPGKYQLFAKSGESQTGFVFPDVINYDNEKTDSKLAFADGTLAYQNEIAAHKKEGADGHGVPTPPGSTPHEGDLGFFYYHDSGQVVATEPFTVNQIATVDGRKAVYAETEKGKKIRFLITPNINGITKLTDPAKDELSVIGETVYLIPEKMTYVDASDKKQLVSRPGDNPDKVKQAGSTTLTYDSETNTFGLAGSAEEVYKLPDGEDFRCDAGEKFEGLDGLERHEAKFILSTMGVPKEKAEKLITQVRKEGSVKVANEQRPAGAQQLEEKTASMISEAKRVADSIRQDCVKEAAVLSQNADKIKEAAGDSKANKNSVDSLLSLSLVREENLNQYVDEIDTYESVLQDLSELLLLSRIGAHNLPEEALRNAIKSLDKVLGGLDQLKSIFS